MRHITAFIILASLAACASPVVAPPPAPAEPMVEPMVDEAPMVNLVCENGVCAPTGN